MKKKVLSMLLSLLIPLGAVAQEAYAVLDGTNLTFYYDNQKADRSGTKYNAYMSLYAESPEWSSQMSNITKVVFDPSFVNARPPKTRLWFRNGSNLSTIEGLEYLNTSDVTDMAYMFAYSPKLSSLDLSTFDTGKVTDMSNMFYSCSGLTSINMSGLGGDKLTSMYSMFYGCTSLTSLNLSRFTTSNVKRMSYMFRDCRNLTSLDLSSFDTHSVTDMTEIFRGCSKLESLNLSSFDTSNVTAMGSMFSSCSKLATLDVSSFNTSKVTNMGSMFSSCSELTELDLSSFDTGKLSSCDNMFLFCSKLTTIYCGNLWNMSNANTTSWMFEGCSKLVGGEGTVYNSSQTDKTYAHADGGTDNPGYLTLKEEKQVFSINLTDNSELLNVHNGEAGDVTLEYDLAAGKWLTLCLPFNVEADKLKEVFGDDVDLEELITSTWDEETQALTMKFTSSSSIVAGNPYLVKVATTVSHPTFVSVNINNKAPETSLKLYCAMTGVYNATPLTVGDKSTLFIQDNKFYYPSVASSLPATKCYFTLMGEAVQARQMNMNFENGETVTAILSLKASTTDQQSWYTPQGVRVSQPGKGLYIHGGKKVIVK